LELGAAIKNRNLALAHQYKLAVGNLMRLWFSPNMGHPRMFAESTHSWGILKIEKPKLKNQSQNLCRISK